MLLEIRMLSQLLVTGWSRRQDINECSGVLYKTNHRHHRHQWSSAIIVFQIALDLVNSRYRVFIVKRILFYKRSSYFTWFQKHARALWQSEMQGGSEDANSGTASTAKLPSRNTDIIMRSHPSWAGFTGLVCNRRTFNELSTNEQEISGTSYPTNVSQFGWPVRFQQLVIDSRQVASNRWLTCCVQRRSALASHAPHRWIEEQKRYQEILA